MRGLATGTGVLLCAAAITRSYPVEAMALYLPGLALILTPRRHQ